MKPPSIAVTTALITVGLALACAAPLSDEDAAKQAVEHWLEAGKANDPTAAKAVLLERCRETDKATVPPVNGWDGTMNVDAITVKTISLDPDKAAMEWHLAGTGLNGKPQQRSGREDLVKVDGQWLISCL